MIKSLYQGKFPEFELNDRWILREQTAHDTQAFYDYYTDPEVARYILATNPANLMEALEEVKYCRSLFYDKRGLYWAIADKNTNTMIGSIGFYINNFHHRAELSYDLSRAYWRQGIMSQAIQCVLDFAFNPSTEIFRVEAVTLAENQPSIDLLLKNNFTHEGTLQNYRYFKGQPFDIEMLAITPKQHSTASS